MSFIKFIPRYVCDLFEAVGEDSGTKFKLIIFVLIRLYTKMFTLELLLLQQLLTHNLSKQQIT